MSFQTVLYPLFLQVLLTFVVMFRMYSLRISEMKAKRIHPETVKTRKQFLERVTDSASASDNFSNLFELPVLFYAAMLLALNFLLHDPLLIAMAWLYVVLRAIHSFIHTSYNTVIHRFYVFAISAFVLLAIWVRLGALILIK